MQSLIICLCISVMTLPIAGCLNQQTRAEEKNDPAGRPSEQEVSGVRWLDLGEASPHAMALSASGNLAIISAGCETILYDLKTGRRLLVWPDRKSVSGFSGDGTYLLTATRSEVELWDVALLKSVQRFAGDPQPQTVGNRHGPPLTAVSDNAESIAISNHFQAFDSRQPTSVLLYGRDGQLRHSIGIPTKARLTSLRLLPADRIIIQYRNYEQGRYRNRTHLYDSQTGNLIHTFPSDSLVRESRHGQVIASANDYRGAQRSKSSPKPMKLEIRDTKSAQILRTVTRPFPLRDFALSPDGKKVLFPSRYQVFELAIDSGETLFESDPSEKPYAGVLYSPDGTRRFAVTEVPNGFEDDVDHHLVGWQVDSGKPLPIKEYWFTSYNGDERLFFYPSGDRFVDLGADFAVRDVLSGEALTTMPKHRAPAYSTEFMPDGSKFLVNDFLFDTASGRGRQWYLETGKRRFLPDGETVYRGNQYGVTLVDVSSGVRFWSLRLQSLHAPGDISVSPDGKHAVLAYRINYFDPQPRILIVRTGQPDHPTIVRREANEVEFHPGGERWVGATVRSVDEYDISGKKLQTLFKPPGRLLFLRYSNDGNRLLAGGVVGHADFDEIVEPEDEGWAVIYDRKTQNTTALSGHSGPVTSGQFNSDGTRAVTGSMDKTIRLWDDAGQPIHVFRGHLGMINDVAYSPKGDRILSAAEDGAAFWDVAGVVDINAKPTSLADKFEVIESINSYSGRYHQNRKTEKLFADADTAKPRDLTGGTADRVVIEVGDTSRLPTLQKKWFQQAKRNLRVPGPRPTEKLPPLYGYEYHNTSADGERSIYSSPSNREIVVVTKDNKIQARIAGRVEHRGVAISPSGKKVLLARQVQHPADQAERSYNVHVYDAESAKELRVFEDIPAWYVHSLKIDPNEQTFLLQTNNNSLQLRDYNNGELLGQQVNSPAGAGLHSGYSPDGKFVVTSKFPEPSIYFLDPRKLGEVKSLENDLSVRWFRFSPDGQHLLAAQEYSEECMLLTCWDWRSGEVLWSQAGRAGEVGSFSRNGKFYLAKAGWEDFALWDLKTGEIPCAVVSQRDVFLSNSADQPTLHLGGPGGRLLWPQP